MVKNLPANAGDIRDMVQSQGQEDPWRRAWQPTPIFSPGERPGQRNLVGYRPCGCKMSGRTEAMHALLYTEARNRRERLLLRPSGGMWLCQQLGLNF